MRFQQTILSNGLRVAAETYSSGYSASYGFFVRAGSRNESDPQAGLSHFLEHMMFKGTSRRTAFDINRGLDELGGNGNAYTTEEQTVYHAKVLPKFQSRIVDLLTDMMRPTLADDDFEVERKVILEEIAKYEDQPPFGAFERVMELHFGPRDLGRRVLGTTESIEAMTAERMRDYFMSKYQPSNMVFAAAGKVDFEALVAQLEQLTSSWISGDSAGGNPSLGSKTEGDLPEGISLQPRIDINDASQAYLVQMMPGLASGDPKRYAASILASILGEEGSSRLFWDLIDTGRAEVATLWPQEFSDCGAWFKYLICHPDDLDANRKLMDNTIEHALDGNITDTELVQTINRSVASLVLLSERPSNRLFAVGGRWLMHGIHEPLDQVIDSIKAVTLDDLYAVARQTPLKAQTEVIAA